MCQDTRFLSYDTLLVLSLVVDGVERSGAEALVEFGSGTRRQENLPSRPVTKERHEDNGCHRKDEHDNGCSMLFGHMQLSSLQVRL